MDKVDTVAGDGNVDGLDVDAAVEQVLSRDDSAGAETVRAVFESVADDGVVTWEGVRGALDEASTVVSTPATRIELAQKAIDEAREASSHVDDLAVVATRLEDLESRLEPLPERLADLQSRLDSVGDRAETGVDLYVVAADIQRLETAANEVQRQADELKLDVEAFDRWVTSPALRYDELDEDLDAVEGSIDELASTVGGLAAAVGEHSGDGSVPGAESVDDPGALWFGGVLQLKTLRFMAADIRSDAEDFRTWAEREDAERRRLDGLEARLDDVSERLDELGDRLDDIATAEWVDSYAEDIAAFDADLDGLEHPADWGDVDRLLDDQRAAVDR